MAAGQKYIGKIYEGRWKVDRFERYKGLNKSKSGKFILVNIYNGEERSVKDQVLRRIDRGEITLSFVFCLKVRREIKYGHKAGWNNRY